MIRHFSLVWFLIFSQRLFGYILFVVLLKYILQTRA